MRTRGFRRWSGGERPLAGPNFFVLDVERNDPIPRVKMWERDTVGFSYSMTLGAVAFRLTEDDFVDYVSKLARSKARELYRAVDLDD